MRQARHWMRYTPSIRSQRHSPSVISAHWRRWRLGDGQDGRRNFSATRICGRDAGAPRQPGKVPAVQGAPSRPEDATKSAPETAKRPDQAKPAVSSTDPLLGGDLVSNKEQRKADWAIMKEMTRYLWPKVCIHEPHGDSVFFHS